MTDTEYDKYCHAIDMQRQKIANLDGRHRVTSIPSPIRTLIQRLIVDWLISSGVDSPAVLMTPVFQELVNSKLDRVDYAWPMFAYASDLKMAPHAVAEKCILELGPRLLREHIHVEAIGPYVNFHLADEALKKEVTAVLAQDSIYGSCNIHEGRTAVIDFSSPNIAKPFGVNHLRSTVLGAAIANLLSATGYKIIRDNHLGDWGTQFGNLIAAHEAFGEGSEFTTLSVEQLNKLYVKFSQEKKINPELVREGRVQFRRLNSGDPQLLKKWKHAFDASMMDFERVYNRLGIDFDTTIGEAYFKDRARAIVDELLEKQVLGLVRDKQTGSVYINSDDHPVPVRTSDGYELYAARDFATIEQRMKDYSPDSILYVVGEEQATSFKAVFNVAIKSGLTKRRGKSDTTLEHIGFGLLLDAEGKKLSTRKGTSGNLESVLDQVRDHALAGVKKRNRKSMDQETAYKVAEMLAVAAIKWNDLRTDRVSSVKFDIDKMLNLENGSVVSVIYTLNRSLSLLNHVANEHILDKVEGFSDGSERALVAFFTMLDEAILRAAETREPHHLVSYLIRLSKLHGKFYENCRVVGEGIDPDSQQTRVTIHKAYVKIVRFSLEMLGIRAPDAI